MFCVVLVVDERYFVVSFESFMFDDISIVVFMIFREVNVVDCFEGSVFCVVELAYNDMEMCMVECVEFVDEDF